MRGSGCGTGLRQPSCGGTSRMTRECQVRICERLGVKFPGPTRRRRNGLIASSVMGMLLSEMRFATSHLQIGRSHPLTCRPSRTPGRVDC